MNTLSNINIGCLLI